MNSDRLKVLYISYDGLLDPVGQSQIVPYVCGFAKNGIGVFLVSFEKKIRLLDKSFSYLRDYLATKGIHWIHFTYHNRPAILGTFFDIFRGFLECSTLIKKNNIRIIHGRGYMATLIAYTLKRFLKISFIFDMRGFWPEEKVDAGAWKKRGLLYLFIKLIEKRLIRSADEIIVLTDAAKKIITYQHNLANITVIPCCVDLETFSNPSNTYLNPSLPRNRLLITYLGSTGTFYNFEETAKFFRIVKRKIEEAYFLILSNGNKEYIMQTLAKLNINSCDYHLTCLSYNQVPLYLSSSAFSLIFYRRTLSASGCCPIKFAESLACGVPVVINAGIGDCDQIIRREAVGVILKGYSPECFAQAVQEMGDLLVNKSEVVQRCHLAAKKIFSLEDGIDRYSIMYRRLINR